MQMQIGLENHLNIDKISREMLHWNSSEKYHWNCFNFGVRYILTRITIWIHTSIWAIFVAVYTFNNAMVFLKKIAVV